MTLPIYGLLVLTMGVMGSALRVTQRRLHIISVTTLGDFERLSVVAEQSWKQHLGENDGYTNICDPGCGNIFVNGSSLGNPLPLLDSDFAGSPPSGRDSGYWRATYKFVWGFVHEYRRIASQGGPMPKWWFVKDDDTYVHIDRLMSFAADYDPNKRVLIGSLGNGGCAEQAGFNYSAWNLNGGGGWLASAALAEALVVTHGDEWMRWQEHRIREGCAFYDNAIAYILDKIEGKQVVHSDQFWGVGRHDPVCPEVNGLISLHMKKQWFKATTSPHEMVRLTENCFNDSHY
jgi:hypothetical protein